MFHYLLCLFFCFPTLNYGHYLALQQTDAAASRVKDILADNADDSVIGVRIGVKTRAFIILAFAQLPMPFPISLLP